MNWSGCPAGCGNHLVADIGLLGKRVKVNGEVVDAVDIFVGGRSGPDAKLAVKVMEDVPVRQAELCARGTRSLSQPGEDAQNAGQSSHTAESSSDSRFVEGNFRSGIRARP